VPHPLDNPVLSSLTGPHAGFAEQRGRILRYPVDVCPFLALPDEPDEADWADAAELAMPGGLLPLARGRISPPPGWKVTVIGEGVQMTGDDLAAADPPAGGARPSDVPEMLDLAGRTNPGPFLKRTIELGTYLGLRHEGKLVAMAGERLHPAGWAEISAVCTDQAWRGRGLATRLVRALGARIRARGEIPFLHALTANTTAIRLYEDLGFRHRRTLQFAVARVPQARLSFGTSRRRRLRRARSGLPAQFRGDPTPYSRCRCLIQAPSKPNRSAYSNCRPEH